MIRLVSHMGTRCSYHGQSAPVTGALQSVFPSLPLPQTRLVPNGIASHRHRHGKERAQGRRAGQLHGAGGMSAHKRAGSLQCSLMASVERRWRHSRVFPQGAPLDRAHTHMHTRAKTLPTDPATPPVVPC